MAADGQTNDAAGAGVASSVSSSGANAKAAAAAADTSGGSEITPLTSSSSSSSSGAGNNNNSGGNGGGGKKKKMLSKQQRRETIARLKREAREELPALAVGGVALVASTIANAAIPTVLGNVLDRTSQGGGSSSTTTTPFSTFTTTTSMETCPSSPSSQTCARNEAETRTGVVGSSMLPLALIILGGGVASFLRTTYLKRAKHNIIGRLRKKVFSSLITPRRPMSYFDDSEHSPGSLGVVLTEDVEKTSAAVTLSFASALRSLSSVSYSTVLMYQISPSLLALSASIVPLIGGAAMVFYRYAKRLGAEQRAVAERAADFANERLAHVDAVKMCGREDDEARAFAEFEDRAVALSRKVSLADGAFMGGIFAATSAALLLVFRAGGKAVAEGKMSSGSLTSFATYSFLLGVGTSGLFKATGEVSAGIISAERIFAIIGDEDGGGNESESESESVRFGKTSSPTRAAEGDNDREAKERVRALTKACTGTVQLNDVFFSYSSFPDKYVLQNCSLELKAGNVLALLGKNGAGKSTIVSLLGALYQPTGGSITLDGVPVSSIPRKNLCRLISVVPQEPCLFSTSVTENIRYANPDASDEEVEHAAKIANCSGFISKLEGGMQYNVGRDGSRLSGGQRQRIALARALLTNPAVLVLDEPTSQLDAEGEGAVDDAVQICRKAGRSLLLITHRLSTLAMADKVAVLREGTVIECGQYDELRGQPDSALCRLLPDLV